MGFLGSLVGGIFGRSRDKRQIRHVNETNAANRAYSDKIRQQDRGRFVRDRANDRAYFDAQRTNERTYQDTSAERTAASRGIDWSRLRQDAEAAGYNPLTALGMAGAYSTEVGYGNAQVGMPGGSAGMGPTGSSYQAQFNPSLAGGSFVEEAISRGVDTWFNTPQKGDPLADALRNALSEETWQDMQRKRDFRRDFGYSLNPERVVRTAVSGLRTPALSPDEEGGLKTFTGPSGRPWQVGPGDAAEDVEEQYGEPGSALQGIGNLIYDAGQSARRWAYGFDVTLEDDERHDPARRRPIPSKWRKPALARGPSHRARNTAIQRDRYRQSIGGW